MLNSRSYAGITRIRFKGPARRYLSTVQCPPRNEVMMERRGLKVNRAAFAFGNYCVSRIFE